MSATVWAEIENFNNGKRFVMNLTLRFQILALAHLVLFFGFTFWFPLSFLLPYSSIRHIHYPSCAHIQTISALLLYLSLWFSDLINYWCLDYKSDVFTYPYVVVFKTTTKYSYTLKVAGGYLETYMRICRIFWFTANISDFSDKDDYDDECRWFVIKSSCELVD